MLRFRFKKDGCGFLILRTAIVIGGIIFVIGWLCDEQRWSKFTEIFFRIRVGNFLGVLGAFIISQAIVVLRWWLLLRTQSIVLRPGPCIRLHFLGLFYNNFLPSSVGGDLIRAWYVTKHTNDKLEAFLSVFVDRIIGLLGTVILATCSLWLFLRSKELELNITYSTNITRYIFEHKLFLIPLMAIVFLVACGTLVNHRSRQLLLRSCHKIKTHCIQMTRKVQTAIIMYCKRPFTMIGMVTLTLVSHSLVIIAFWLLGVSLGIEAGLDHFLVFFPISWIMGVLPISIGGVVVVEGWLVLLFTQFANATAEQILMLALCQRGIWMVVSLPGAVVHLTGAHLPKDSSAKHWNSIINRTLVAQILRTKNVKEGVKNESCTHCVWE